MNMRVEKKIKCVSLIRSMLLIVSIIFFSLWAFWEASSVWAWLAVGLDTVEIALYWWQYHMEKPQRLERRHND